jgi:hypothetical protein
MGQLSGNIGTLAGAQSSQAGTGTSLGQYATQTPLNYLEGSITNGQSALSPLLSAYQNQLSSAYSPLYQQQIGPYQQQTAQAYANYQGAMGQYNGFNSLLSSYLDPFGGAAGTLGGSYLGSMGSMGGSISGGASAGGALGGSGDSAVAGALA